MTNSLNKFKKFDLENKNALITGAGGLLGREHCEALLESGSNLVLTDINSKTLETNYKYLKSKFSTSSISSYIMDVSDKSSIKAIFNKLSKEKIGIDILINNAAIDHKYTKTEKINKSSRLEDFSTDQWDLEIKVGLTGALNCIQIFGNSMVTRNKGGVILNVASDLSVIAPNQDIYKNENLDDKYQSVKPVTYSVIKTGLVGLTKYVATYWANKNIRCNSISPGGVFNNHDEKFVNRVSKLIPLGRMAKKEEYRSAIQFLCSDASSYMTGHNLVIDGGRSIW